ncbi:MAG TPA: non-homologous end-joining DNA ligase, partial [Chthonomonadaceae bacterium]|nr:non-homologous end-joining DNA ligase [Chthonomonadaceae bacterium]
MPRSYAEKRNFAQSPEPAGLDSADSQRNAAGRERRFVIHKHRARRLHYDLRLEHDGALKSWAVPKGPSLDPSVRRLAVMVEDHPLAYAAFEDVIPAGEYGAGDVIVWDEGTWAPLSEEDLELNGRAADRAITDGLRHGKLSFALHGKKLLGSWALVRKRDGDDWLLLKHRDAFADAEHDVLSRDRSAVSGRTIDELHSGRLAPAASVMPSQRPEAARYSDAPTGARRATVGAIPLEPMLAGTGDAPFTDKAWLFEPKLDGMRALAIIAGGESAHRRSHLFSRRGIDITQAFPALVAALSNAVKGEVVLDGEIVSPDASGAPSFQRLQQRMNLRGAAAIARADIHYPVQYFAFDLLYADGYDLRAVPLDRRKRRLACALHVAGPVQLVAYFPEVGESAYAHAIRHGFEGVVAKRLDSRYESGRRSQAWLKIKETASDEFVIGGYTQGAGRRAATFGSLLLGQFDSGGRLQYAGHVGTGFDERTLNDVLRSMEPLRSPNQPFAASPRANAPVTWLRPELVATVRYMARTADGILRAPVFVGLRQDKEAAEARTADPAVPPANVGPADGASEIGQVLEALGARTESATIEVGGYRMELTNLDKPLWPKLGERRAIVKRDLLAYLAECSPFLLTHMRDRPLTLRRYPNGIAGKSFYQRHWPHALPEFVETIRGEQGGEESSDRGDSYLLCNNLATLLWLGQLAVIELHTWLSRDSRFPDAGNVPVEGGYGGDDGGALLDYPDFILFDLDPYLYSGHEAPGAEPELSRAAYAVACEVARRLRALIESLGLELFVKTSGKTGLHLLVPVVRRHDFAAIRAACETIGRYLMKAYPNLITMEWTTERRTGKV